MEYVMNIIIVDDSAYKRDCIKEYIKAIFPDARLHEFSCCADCL